MSQPKLSYFVCGCSLLCFSPDSGKVWDDTWEPAQFYTQ